jgi:hypothetical protein
LCSYNGSNLKLNNYDILLDSKYYNIVNKILYYNKITSLYHGQGYFNIKTNNSNLSDDNKLMKCYLS